MRIEERVRGSLLRTAEDVAPPTIDVADLRENAMRHRRRNRAMAVSTAVAVIALSGYGYAVGPGSDHDSSNSTGQPPRVQETTTGDAGLDPGRHWVPVEGTPLRANVAVGAGWHRSGSQIFTDSATIQFWSVETVYRDACEQLSGTRPVRPHSVAQLALLLDRQASTDLSPSHTVRLGGLTGVRFAIIPSSGIDPTACDLQSLYLWDVAENGNHVSRYTTHPEMLWILDAAGTTIIIDGQYDLGDSAEADAVAKVVESVRVPPTR